MNKAEGNSSGAADKTQVRMQMRPPPAQAAVTMPTTPPSVTPRSGSGGPHPCRSTGRALRPERARSVGRAALGCPAASRSTPWRCRRPTGRALQVQLQPREEEAAAWEWAVTPPAVPIWAVSSPCCPPRVDRTGLWPASAKRRS